MQQFLFPPKPNFIAIDFETATGFANSACSVGIVHVVEGEIIEEFYSLLRPPGNNYHWGNIRVHGINPEDTENAPTIKEILPDLLRLMKNKLIVAHNESFDRNVLQQSLAYHNIDMKLFNIPKKWECTVKIFRARGHKPNNLAACCKTYNIPLIHHNAISDALACAKLFLIHKETK
jgi:DNA polymerase III subunit epsilon